MGTSSGSAGSGSGSGSSHGGSVTARGGGTGSSGEPVLVPGGQPGSLIHSSSGFGSSPTVPGLHKAADTGFATVESDSSSAPLIAILLAAVVMTIGGYAGVRAWRTAGRRPRASSS